MARAEQEKVVYALIELARRELSGDPPRSTVRTLPDLRRRAARAPWLVPAFAALVFATGLVWWVATPASITYAVVSGTERGGVVVGSQATRLLFSEGSEVLLEQGAETEISELSAQGGSVRLRRGRARVSITPRADAEWLVQAGPYAVRVTGTEFDVAWSEAERVLEVSMRTGSVEVTGASLAAPIHLRAGQRLVRRGDDARPAVEPVPLPTSSSANVAPSQDPAEERTAVEDAVGRNSRGPQPARPAEVSWSKQVAQGKFQEVLQAAEQRGLENVLARASLADLRAVSDAARYARRTGVAERALLSQRQRFGTSTAARDAAFLLGQLTESHEQAAALAWYDTYLREAPNGSYASQALGRKMMIAYRADGATRADAIATDYLVRYPRGPYAAAARRIVAEARGRRQP